MKKNRALLLLLLLIGITTSAAWAQVNIKQVDVDGSTTESNSITKEELLTRISGVAGIDNLLQLAVEANQAANITINGDKNTATITQQNGTGNIGAINILGKGNKSSLLQNGNDLLSLISIQGDNNQLNVTQEGDNLGNLVQVDGVDDINIDITQNEEGLQYTQRGGNSIPLVMTSNRRNVPIIISNN